MKKVLAVFCKYPTPGRVKTRLAKDTSDIFAAEVYSMLLVNVLTGVYELQKILSCFDLMLYIDNSSDIHRFEELLNRTHIRVYAMRIQAQGDMGYRIGCCFRELFHDGYDKVVIIGSDLVGDLSVEIKKAYDILETNQMVFGPSFDGGFYLIGAKDFFDSCVLSGLRWSSSEVFKNLLGNVKDIGYKYGLLNPLLDIDTMEDLLRAKREGLFIYERDF
ncbi:MAG: TIGR04282 family arsenosugar biosynthesis glycosyltransferase [Calditerrivibrio sp.]|nr:TIGR04282 family arsenosugar biosynthesis glycosyltransferase [Calditerrivibrio sp.]